MLGQLSGQAGPVMLGLPGQQPPLLRGGCPGKSDHRATRPNEPNEDGAKSVRAEPTPEAADFVVTLRPTRSDVRPPITRLRGLLKIALRAFGLKCVGLGLGNGPEANP